MNIHQYPGVQARRFLVIGALLTSLLLVSANAVELLRAGTVTAVDAASATITIDDVRYRVASPQTDTPENVRLSDIRVGNVVTFVESGGVVISLMLGAMLPGDH
ncbi:MAG: hypothetical protein PHQ14_06495 [Chromatiales bacterium]|jgi:hypothetical protein|nr:hypothetical protein [Chromatiales bacterium]